LSSSAGCVFDALPTDGTDGADSPRACRLASMYEARSPAGAARGAIGAGVVGAGSVGVAGVGAGGTLGTALFRASTFGSVRARGATLGR
ncbi:MAG: hypothetical protein ACXWC3_03190, partial [Burkholderiales bacterium]